MNCSAVKKQILIDFQKYKCLIAASSGKEACQSSSINSSIDPSPVNSGEVLFEDALYDSLKSQSGVEEQELTKDILLLQVSKNLRSRVSRIIEFLLTLKTFKWDNTGRVYINDVVISGSHILDLVLKCITTLPSDNSKPSPVGLNLFLDYLKKNNVPKNLITNKGVRHLLDSPEANRVEDRVEYVTKIKPNFQNNVRSSKWYSY